MLFYVYSEKTARLRCLHANHCCRTTKKQHPCAEGVVGACLPKEKIRTGLFLKGQCTMTCEKKRGKTWKERRIENFKKSPCPQAVLRIYQRKTVEPFPFCWIELPTAGQHAGVRGIYRERLCGIQSYYTTLFLYEKRVKGGFVDRQCMEGGQPLKSCA